MDDNEAAAAVQRIMSQVHDLLEAISLLHPGLDYQFAAALPLDPLRQSAALTGFLPCSNPPGSLMLAQVMIDVAIGRCRAHKIPQAAIEDMIRQGREQARGMLSEVLRRDGLR